MTAVAAVIERRVGGGWLSKNTSKNMLARQGREGRLASIDDPPKQSEESLKQRVQSASPFIAA